MVQELFFILPMQPEKEELPIYCFYLFLKTAFGTTFSYMKTNIYVVV